MKKNYKIKLICLLCACTTIFSNCKKSETIDEKGLNNKHNTLAGNGRDGKNDLLGYGYNVLGEFGNASAATRPVIDVDRLRAEHQTRVIWDASTETKGYLTAGSNAESYLKKITARLSTTFGYQFLGMSLFKATITANYSNNDVFSSKYIYSNYYLKVQQRRVKLNTLNEVLQSYLDPEFVSYVNTQTPEAVVNRYGTHVLADIILGGKLDVTYQSQTTKSDKTHASSAGIDLNVKKIFNLNVGYTYDANDVKENFDQTLHYATIGGDPTKSLIGDIVVGNASNPNPTPTVNISAWQSSCTPENSVLIDIAPDGLLPIWELVADQVKKEQIKNVAEKYISDGEAKLVADGLKYGIYKITNIISSQALTIPNYKGSSYKNGTDACQWPWYDGSEQKWSVQKLVDGAYQITNLKSNQALTIPNYSGSSYKNGTNACQWPWYEGSEQKWSLEKIVDNTYKVINGKSNQVLTIPNYNNSSSLYKNGTNACQWPWYGGNEQKWKFELIQEL